MTRALLTDAAPEEFLGIRFRPGEAFRYLRFPAAEGTDLDLDLAAIPVLKHQAATTAPSRAKFCDGSAKGSRGVKRLESRTTARAR